MVQLWARVTATREAFKKGLIENGEVWMDMIKSRNLSSHTYHKGIADQISQQVSERYLGLFEALKNKLGQHQIQNPQLKEHIDRIGVQLWHAV